MAVLVRTDPFRELDRLTQQMFGGVGTATRPTVMPMDAWRDGEEFVLEFDLPGINPDSVDLDVERNVLTIKAERKELHGDHEVLAAERPRGVFSRQLVLGDNLDLSNVSADYSNGVLSLRVPVAEQAKPRKIPISTSGNGQRAIAS